MGRRRNRRADQGTGKVVGGVGFQRLLEEAVLAEDGRQPGGPGVEAQRLRGQLVAEEVGSEHADAVLESGRDFDMDAAPLAGS
jgi:hypothetical protein